MATPIPYRVTAGNKAVAIIGSAQTIYSYHITNRNSVIVYVKFYNKAAASVDPATDTPATVLTVPAATSGDAPGILDNSAASIAFATAISVRCTTINQDKSTQGPAIEPLIEVDLAQSTGASTIDSIVDSISGFKLSFDTSALTADRQIKSPDAASVSVVPSAASARSFLTGVGADGVITSASPVVKQTVSVAADTAVTTGATFVNVTATLSTAITLTLPAIANYNDGETIVVMDGGGTCSSTKAIIVAPNGAETISGSANSVQMDVAYGVMLFTRVSNTNWKMQHAASDSGNVTIARNVASVSCTAAAGTTTNIFQVPINKSFLLASASAVLTTVTGFDNSTPATLKIETSAGVQMAPLASGVTWDAAGEVISARLDNVTGKVATAGQTVRVNNVAQNTSTALTCTVFITGILY